MLSFFLVQFVKRWQCCEIDNSLTVVNVVRQTSMNAASLTTTVIAMIELFVSTPSALTFVDASLASPAMDTSALVSDAVI